MGNCRKIKKRGAGMGAPSSIFSFVCQPHQEILSAARLFRHAELGEADELTHPWSARSA